MKIYTALLDCKIRELYQWGNVIKILFDINRALLLGYQNKCKLIFDVVGAEQETYVVPNRKGPEN